MPLSPTDLYRLEKGIWTDADLDRMSWHDVVVHAMAFQTETCELMLDIDYMFPWVNPEPPSPYFSFWLSPATLVFHDVRDMKMEYELPSQFALRFQLQGLERASRQALPEGPQEEWRWTLDGIEGAISFWATGFTQFTRRTPVRHSEQNFLLTERGGVSFERAKSPL